MNLPERMCLESADGQESYVAMVHVTPAAVSFKMGFTFAFNRESVRQVCERLLVLLGPCPECHNRFHGDIPPKLQYCSKAGPKP